MRFTTQRNVILQELEQRKDHPTADEIFHAVRDKIPNISLSTVYRNLETMYAHGNIQKIGGKEQSRFDYDTSRHGHFRCIHCGKLEDLPPGSELPEIPASQWKDARRIEGVVVEFVGVCPDCKE